MTTTVPETPDLGTPRGSYSSTLISSHVRNLLARSNQVTSSALTPTIVAAMRKHYQVSSALTVQSLPLIRADWTIECDDDKVREALTAAYSRVAFTTHRSMTRALWAGYSPNTLTWDYVEELRGIYPTEVRDLDPGTCTPLVDADGTLDGFQQRNGGATEDFDRVYTLWIVENLESGNYYGRSILEAALDPYRDWAAFRAFHARYLERFGEPVVLARAPAGKTITNAPEIEAAVAAGTTPPEPVVVDNLDVALETGENLRHHSVVALPSSLLFGADGKPTGFAWNLEFLTAPSGGGIDFREGLNLCDRNIGRAMFVPDLLTQNTADVGSNALGQTHKGVWEDSVEGRLDDYSRQITDQLLTPARLLNFGDRSPHARLVFAPLSDEEADRLWSLVVALVDHGQLPDLDVREVTAGAGLPLLDETVVADRAAQAAAAAASTPAAAVSNRLPVPDISNLDRRVTFAASDAVAGLPDWKLPQSYDPPPYHRALNNRERRVGFGKLEDGLNGSEATILDALTSILDNEHDRVLRQLAGIVKKGTAAEVIAALGTLEIKGGPAVTKAWSDLMAEVGALAVEGLRSELSAYADKIPDVGPDGRALFRAYAQTAADRTLTQLLTETRLGLLNAYTSGVSRAGMAAIVGQVFDSYAASEGKPVRLTTRMLSAKSLNYSRASSIDRGGIPLAGAQYSAILDRRTCELCADLDEKVIAVENTDLARFTPPVHHNCRCLWVWITRDEEDFTPTWSTPAPSKVDRFGGLVVG